MRVFVGMFEMELSDSEEGLMNLNTMARTVSMPLMDDAKTNLVPSDELFSHSHQASAFHPFSDTDITPIMR